MASIRKQLALWWVGQFHFLPTHRDMRGAALLLVLPTACMLFLLPVWLTLLLMVGAVAMVLVILRLSNGSWDAQEQEDREEYLTKIRAEIEANYGN